MADPVSDLAALAAPPTCHVAGPAVAQVPPSPAELLGRLRTDFPRWAFLRTPDGWWHALHHREVISRSDPAAIRAQVETKTNTRRGPQ
jgi:hypothetical protein